jgi:ATP-binding cassette subfamily C protein
MAVERPALLDENAGLRRACELVAAGLGITLAAAPPRGAGREALGDLMRASRVRTRRVMLRADWWRQDNGPLLGWERGTGRPLALLVTPQLRYEVVDPVTGARTPLSRATADTLEPFADAFYTPFPARALRVLDLLAIGLANCRRRDLARILVIGALGGVLGMAPAVAPGSSSTASCRPAIPGCSCRWRSRCWCSSSPGRSCSSPAA